jgi:hemerythrin-like domain-containing protein
MSPPASDPAEPTTPLPMPSSRANAGAARALHDAPSSGFDDPFGMLDACHDRVERMLALLGKLRAHLLEKGCDADAQQAARDVIRYFDIAGPAHHADEEKHVFPTLLAAGRLVVEVQRLQRDHVEFEAAWSRVRPALARVVDGAWVGMSMHEEAALSSFASIYERHLPLEENLVFPAARELMDQERLALMGREMAQRRGLR